MNYYEKITFTPTLDANTETSDTFKRLAWVEDVACTILNHTKEDCCFTIRKILETLIEADRFDLLPGNQCGKTGDEVNLNHLIGAATSKFRKAVGSKGLCYWGQIGILQNWVKVPLASEHRPELGEEEGKIDCRLVEFYYFFVNPDLLREYYTKGLLPKSTR
jgi:hypothetical protein